MTALDADDCTEIEDEIAQSRTEPVDGLEDEWKEAPGMTTESGVREAPGGRRVALSGEREEGRTDRWDDSLGERAGLAGCESLEGCEETATVDREVGSGSSQPLRIMLPLGRVPRKLIGSSGAQTPD